MTISRFHKIRSERSNQRLLRFSMVFLLLTVLSACSEPPYKNLDNVQFQALLQDRVPLYDIRRADEWRETGVIGGSQLLTFVDADGRVKPDFLNRFTSVVDKHDAVILICRTGSRTRTLARYLIEQMGYTQVYNVRHGITRWISDDRPVKTL